MQTNYKYFKFIEGRYFRLNEESYKFQILNDDNLWEDNYDVESVVFMENDKLIDQVTKKDLKKSK